MESCLAIQHGMESSRGSPHSRRPRRSPDAAVGRATGRCRGGCRAGVTGSLAFFINGRLLSDVQPLEEFIQLIEDELARAR
jgi:hypothetical protein